MDAFVQCRQIETVYISMRPNWQHVTLLEEKLCDHLIQCIKFSMKAFR